MIAQGQEAPITGTTGASRRTGDHGVRAITVSRARGARHTSHRRKRPEELMSVLAPEPSTHSGQSLRHRVRRAIPRGPNAGHARQQASTPETS